MVAAWLRSRGAATMLRSLATQYPTACSRQQAANMNMRIGIFGGTFDPVHYGHLLLAECCREAAGLDQVWFLPSAVAPHKQHQAATDSKARIEMLELATGGHATFSVCRYEADRGGVNFTVDTMSDFRQQHPGDELFFCWGPTRSSICRVGANQGDSPSCVRSWSFDGREAKSTSYR